MTKDAYIRRLEEIILKDCCYTEGICYELGQLEQEWCDENCEGPLNKKCLTRLAQLREWRGQGSG